MEHSDLNKSLRVKSGMKLYEQVLTKIKDLILQGNYRKGDLLPSENELTQMMGVSRITVREALRRLHASGVIETQRGRGSIVRIDANDLMLNLSEGETYRRTFLQATDARILLEPAIAAKLAQTVDSDQISAIQACFDEGRSPAAFHSALVEALGNPVVLRWFEETLALESEPLMTHMIPPTKQGHIVQTLEMQHRKVFEAICKGQDVSAAKFMREHLQYVRDIYEDYFNTYF